MNNIKFIKIGCKAHSTVNAKLATNVMFSVLLSLCNGEYIQKRF